jgi:hypothetical protein
MAVAGSQHFFNANEITDDQVYVVPEAGVIGQLAILRRAPSLFKAMTKFSTAEFEELCTIVYPIVIFHARSTGQIRGQGGRPCKLEPSQRILNCILSLKHDNTSVFDGADWNWSKSSVCDDAVFVASCINVGIAEEIRWPTPQECLVFASAIPRLPGCIGIIDGTLIKVRRSHQDLAILITDVGLMAGKRFILLTIQSLLITMAYLSASILAT